MRRVTRRRQVGDHVAEAVLADIVVALPAVGVNLAAARDVVEHEVGERRLADVGDAPHAHASRRLAAVLNRDHDDRLAGRGATTRAGPHAADIGLVDLDGVLEQLASGQHHRPAQLVQPRPGGLVAAELQHVLQPERGDTILLVDDVPDRREPAGERKAAAVKIVPAVTDVSW